MLDTIKVKETDLSYSSIYQIISFKHAYEFIFHHSMYMAPLEAFLYLKDTLFLQVE